jgi:L-threonylcarbamoyladenylate synthase
MKETRLQRFVCIDSGKESVAVAAEAARETVQAEHCIVLPTDTVYGIAADAFSALAVRRLLDAKGQEPNMPPSVLISEPSLIKVLAVNVPETAKSLVDRHWPGALTVICRIQPSLRMDLGDTGGTIALRVPDHEVARDILRRTGPMAVSSANISGQPAAMTCDEAIEQLGDSVSLYIDGGPLGGAGEHAPSTIVDFTQHDDGEVLRRGAISVETLRETAPNLRDMTDVVEDSDEGLSTGAVPTAEGAAPSAEGSGRLGDGPSNGSRSMAEGSGAQAEGSGGIDEPSVGG